MFHTRVQEKGKGRGSPTGEAHIVPRRKFLLANFLIVFYTFRFLHFSKLLQFSVGARCVPSPWMHPSTPPPAYATVPLPKEAYRADLKITRNLATWQPGKQEKSKIDKVWFILYIRFARLPGCQVSDYFLDFSIGKIFKTRWGTTSSTVPSNSPST